VSMGSVAASGGYWVSTPADFIYAEPSTITGSIGVFGIIPSFQGTLKKLGVGADGVKTTALSGEPDLFKGPSPEASQLIQSGVNSMYGRFLNIVAEARHKTPQQVDQIAQGRVWDGGTARQLGLVDGFGGMSDAIGKAAQRGTPLKDGPRLLGMLAYDGDPDVIQHMLGAVPAPIRRIVVKIGQRAYAKHATRVYGTPTP